MCAAPGSKTAQLIEFLHAEEDKMPTGININIILFRNIVLHYLDTAEWWWITF